MLTSIKTFFFVAWLKVAKHFVNQARADQAFLASVTYRHELYLWINSSVFLVITLTVENTAKLNVFLFFSHFALFLFFSYLGVLGINRELTAKD